jgi:ArsR family transcriptional regulator
MDAAVLKALADPTRLAIVRLLADGERCLCDVSGALGISDALASHHVKKLREAGLVQARRKGLWLHCSLESGAFESLGAELSAMGVTASEAGTAACCSAPAKGDDDG